MVIYRNLDDLLNISPCVRSYLDFAMTLLPSNEEIYIQRLQKLAPKTAGSAEYGSEQNRLNVVILKASEIAAPPALSILTGPLGFFARYSNPARLWSTMTVPITDADAVTLAYRYALEEKEAPVFSNPDFSAVGSITSVIAKEVRERSDSYRRFRRVIDHDEADRASRAISIFAGLASARENELPNGAVMALSDALKLEPALYSQIQDAIIETLNRMLREPKE